MDILCAPDGLSNWEYPGQGVKDIAGSALKQAVFDMAMMFPLYKLRKLMDDAAWRKVRWQTVRDFGEKFVGQGIKLPLGYAPHWGYAAADWPSLTLYQEYVRESIRRKADVCDTRRKNCF